MFSAPGATVKLAEIGLKDQASARVGAAGAPTVVAKTAEYTDRYPDTLQVVATGVEGLEQIEIAP